MRRYLKILSTSAPLKIMLANIYQHKKMFPNLLFISEDEIEGGIKIYDYKGIKK
jgi:hypothetical protein